MKLIIKKFIQEVLEEEYLKAYSFHKKDYWKRKLNKEFDYELLTGVKKGDIDKAIEIDPQQSEYYYFRGLCKSVLKDRNSAIQDYVTAEKLGYKDEQGFPPSELIAKSWYDEFIERMNSKEEGKLKDFTDSLVNKEGKGKVLRFSHQLRKTKK